MKKLAIFGVVLFIVIGFIMFGFFYLGRLPTENEKPIAKIEINTVNDQEIIINEGDELVFSAKNSSDSDGDIEKYLWNFGDGTTSQQVNTLHKFDEPGYYQVTLTVVDDDGNKNVTQIQIYVNGLPTAEAQVGNRSGEKSADVPIYEMIEFDGSGSYDYEGRALSYAWDFGDETNSNNKTVRHQFRSLGIFKVTLTVTDDNGAESMDYVDIDVKKRTYSVEWVLKSKEVMIQENEFTREGQSSETIYDLQQDKLANVTVILNWTDRQPFLRDNESEGNDQFELTFVTSNNITKTQNSTSGNISMGINYNTQPYSNTYQAQTFDEAITVALASTAFSEDGTGDWFYNVTALECKGGSWLDERFDLDIGNSWSLKLIVFYYELEIDDITGQ